VKALSYQDILLVPASIPSCVKSRGEVEVGSYFLDNYVSIPVIPANMDDVINRSMVKKAVSANVFYIYHRFADTVDFCLKFPQYFLPLSISVGIENDSYDLLNRLFYDHCISPDFITVDVANGHSPWVAKMIKFIKTKFLKSKVIAGNVATIEGVNFLHSAGADAVKLGLAQGSICTTRHATGFSIPMFTCVKNIKEAMMAGEIPKIPIIADGGVKCTGDIVKALVAGADLVMCGRLFASCSDSAAKTRWGKKIYHGSTAYEKKKIKRHIEGICIKLQKGCTFLEKVDEIKQHLQSAVTYAGGKDLSCLKNVEWYEVNNV